MTFVYNLHCWRFAERAGARYMCALQYMHTVHNYTQYTRAYVYTVQYMHRRRRWGAGGSNAPPPKFGQNLFFSGKNRVKFGHFVSFFGHLYHVKFGNFVKFSGKSHVKFGHFVKFSCIFSGKNVLPPKVDWAPTPMNTWMAVGAWYGLWWLLTDVSYAFPASR